MESKNFVIGLCVLVCMIQSSFALKCFTCSESVNPKCGNNDLHLVECVFDRISLAPSELGLGGTPTCLKIVSHNGGVVRRCGIKYQNRDVCSAARSSQFKFCGSCDEDACNSGNSMRLLNTSIAFAVMVCIVRFFA